MTIQTQTTPRLRRLQNDMARKGLAADDPLIPNGEYQYFSTPEDIALNKPRSGWYIINPGCPSASFGSFRRDKKFSWRANIGPHDEDLTEEEKSELQAQLETLKQEREKKNKQRAETQIYAAQAARNFINASNPANSTHPYLTKKRIEGKGALQKGDNLIIPMQNQDGGIQNVQVIFPDGSKRFLAHARKKGCYHAIGKATDTIYIAEGYATASSVYEATGNHTIIAFDAGNLLPVSESISDLHPEANIIICADNDQWGTENVGINKARKAAESISASVVYPKFKNSHSNPTDFNDLHLIEGLEEVKRQLSDISHTQINQRYIPPIPNTEGIICIKSAKDTGKTHALEEVIERNRSSSKSTLIVTHRISLSRNISERLRIANYQDFKSPDNLQQENFLIICADSLHKLETTKFSTIILDESEQIIRHFTSKSMRNQVRNLNGLYYLLYNATSIIAMDADLSHLTIELLEHIKDPKQ